MRGSTGAGKTTYPIKLRERPNSVRFSIDEWMARLFWMDSPQPIESAWTMERVLRCHDQIWATASQVARWDVPWVLDLGFGQKAHRTKFPGLAGNADFRLQLHVLDAPADERWRLVNARNSGEADTRQLPFDVMREMFDFVENL